MARLTDEQRELILADYHTGHFTQRRLAQKYKVSTATVNKLTKGLEPKHEDKVNAMVTARASLCEESEQEVNAVHQVVEDRVKHLELFNTSALKNQRKANLAIDKIKDDEITEKHLNPLETHSRITQRNKETVLGKDKTTEINNTNAVQNNNSLKIEFE